jgi:hypothetical protein
MTVEPETVLQPSLYALTAEDWYDLVLGECECRGVDVADLRKDMEADPESEWLNELEDDALDRLHDAGYYVYCAEDTLLIYPKGYEPPKEESTP